MNETEQKTKGDGSSVLGETKGDGSSVLLGEVSPNKTEEPSPFVSQEQPPEIDYTGLPRINWGALFMPAVWGPAHGQWITILFYPLWLFADTSITNAVFFGGLTYALAASVVLGTAAVTILFALTIGQKTYARVAHKTTMQQYKSRERIWALISALIALAFLGLATWYNLAIRLPQGPS